eukprot:scaffold108347_cov53-Phaeocystis_antarctica.AAC.3
MSTRYSPWSYSKPIAPKSQLLSCMRKGAAGRATVRVCASSPSFHGLASPSARRAHERGEPGAPPPRLLMLLRIFYDGSVQVRWKWTLWQAEEGNKWNGLAVLLSAATKLCVSETLCDLCVHTQGVSEEQNQQKGASKRPTADMTSTAWVVSSSNDSGGASGVAQGWLPSHERGSAIQVAVVLWDES